MAFESEKYVTVTSEETKERAGESRLEVLRRWFIECPECSEAWLAPGIKENDWYVCRECGHGFAKPAIAAGQQTSSKTVSILRFV